MPRTVRSYIARCAIAAAALAVVAPVFAATSPTPPASLVAAAVPSNAEPAAALAGGLCGITQADLDDIVEHYDLQPDMEGVQDMLATPFDCGAYGQLCGAITPQQAHQYACQVWTQLESHTSMATVEFEAHATLNEWSNLCPPDPEKCEDICDPWGVEHCQGIVVGNQCKQLALCDHPRFNLFGFKPLVFEAAGPIP